MASEVISDIKIELSDLNYLCYHVYLASKGLHELNPTHVRGDLSSIDLRGFAAGKNIRIFFQPLLEKAVR